MSELIKISTIVQAKYWLEKGETLIFTTIDGNGYITNIGSETLKFYKVSALLQ